MKLVRIAVIVALFLTGAVIAEEANLCCGNPCLPPLNCTK